MRRTLQRSLLVLLLLPALAMAGFSTPAAGQQESRCCRAKRIACEVGCAPCGGVFEFNCDPATCQSSCICLICQ